MESARHQDHSGGPSTLPLLLVLFAASGCAALIYEVVWFQLLELVIGSSAVSLGVLLGTFMGGMCLGSLLLPRMVSPRRHPLRVYALLELGIAALGLLVLFALPAGGRVYASVVGYGLPGFLLRAAVCLLFLLPPTLLMGASLPAMARWVESTPAGVSWLGFFYGGNTAGAVLGCLLAGFYLLRVHDVAVASYCAVALNVVVALAGFAIARFSPNVTATPEAAQRPRDTRIWPVYTSIALSGFSALGAEVVWTRLLSLMLGGTVYTFSLILAAFLLGIGIGSSVGSLIARVAPRPRLALGVCQLLLAGAVAWAAWAISSTLPFLPVTSALATRSRFMFQMDLMRCLWVVLPSACLWGASFPLALAAASCREVDSGRLAGRVYAANTAGAIAGASVFSMALVPLWGTAGSQRVLIAICAVSSLVSLASLIRPFRPICRTCAWSACWATFQRWYTARRARL
jgi:spermidine synthase